VPSGLLGAMGSDKVDSCSRRQLFGLPPRLDLTPHLRRLAITDMRISHSHFVVSQRPNRPLSMSPGRIVETRAQP
jgi:hypothetical protein